MQNKKVELNTRFKQALDVMENSEENLLLTGKAGTGKSTLLDYFRSQSKKKVVVLAPTGVAAINIQGKTIHSFFGFKPDITLNKVKKIKPGVEYGRIYKELDAIIIDEISMVRADLLDCIDKFMRLNGKNKTFSFGGAQMIFIGDLYQIPPVVSFRDRKIFSGHYTSPFFFSSNVFFDANFSYKYIELEKVYRQKDAHFINLLNAIRNNSAEDDDIAALNKRLKPSFKAKPDDFYICLVAVNALADKINEEELKKLSGRTWKNKAKLKGKFTASSPPAPEELTLKAGAQVMLTNNDTEGRWVNGTVGQVVGIKKKKNEHDGVVLEINSGEKVLVYPNKWEIFEYKLENGEISSKIIGSYIQYPIRVAFAITIHKSQGKTFDKVIIDLTRGTFAHGQLYVALSRCTSLEGIVLRKEIKRGHIRMDWNVVKFITGLQYEKSLKKLSMEERIQIITKAIKDKRTIGITYLKGKDENSKRKIIPKKIGQMKFKGYPFLGLRAYCLNRKAERIFSVKRILSIEENDN
ncbi:MAG: AAA family ATPase [Patescibacteria group bacterium]|nr:AAA family ATPase [Patescibacteria group bacterium]